MTHLSYYASTARNNELLRQASHARFATAVPSARTERTRESLRAGVRRTAGALLEVRRRLAPAAGARDRVHHQATRI